MPTKLTQRLNPVAAAPPKRAETKLVNHIALIIDDSGSMSGVRHKAIEVFNEQIAKIKEEASLSEQLTSVSIYKFAERDRIYRLRYKVPPNAVDFITPQEYKADGGYTAMRDAVCMSIDDFRKAADAEDRNVSFLIITITDGMDNASLRDLRSAIADVTKTDRWTFAFLAPPGGTMAVAGQGVPMGNIREWERTEQGMREASVVTSSSLGNYYATRAAGKTHTDSFFTDLSGVSQAQVAKIADITPDFKRIKVEKEAEIAPFIRAKGYDYRLGTAYYELTKPERIASHKQIVIEDRSTKRLHGGPEARRLIGITSGPGVECRVRPGNHANFRIFVSSTSTNRKLVRGTDVLYKVR